MTSETDTTGLALPRQEELVPPPKPKPAPAAPQVNLLVGPGPDAITRLGTAWNKRGTAIMLRGLEQEELKYQTPMTPTAECYECYNVKPLRLMKLVKVHAADNPAWSRTVHMCNTCKSRYIAGAIKYRQVLMP